MNCPNCDVEVQVSRATCPSCKNLLASSNVGTLGSPVRRLVANFLDYFIFGFIFGFIGAFAGSGNSSEAAGAGVGILLLGYVIVQIYMLTQSTSLGKKILGLKVYSTDGKPIGFLKMVLRETLGKWISGLVFSLGFIWLLIDDDNQAWHDKFVNSVVIEEYKETSELPETQSV